MLSTPLIMKNGLSPFIAANSLGTDIKQFQDGTHSSLSPISEPFPIPSSLIRFNSPMSKRILKMGLNRRRITRSHLLAMENPAEKFCHYSLNKVYKCINLSGLRDLNSLA